MLIYYTMLLAVCQQLLRIFMNNLWYDHPIKLTYEKFTLWYNGGMRTVMKDKEELKKAVIESCINGTMTIKVAADRLNFSERYVKKLKARYRKYGASSMMHGNCGKQPKHTISADIKSKIWNILEVKECNFTYFQEILEEDI